VPERIVVCHACATANHFEDMVPRRSECERCHEALHSCLNCTFHDLSAYNECRETSAERVVDKKAGNFCDFFQPASASANAAATAQESAAGALERLFKK
jgi:hypothetical protein